MDMSTYELELPTLKNFKHLRKGIIFSHSYKEYNFPNTRECTY